MPDADKNIAEIWDRGFMVMENFIDAEIAARGARGAVARLSQAGRLFRQTRPNIRSSASRNSPASNLFPFPEWALNRLSVYPDLIDAAERFLGTKEIDLYKSELWAKYSGAINYDQFHHRDYRNHTIVVPRADRCGHADDDLRAAVRCDVAGRADRRSCRCPRRARCRWARRATKFGTYFDKEVSIEGPAGSLMVYKTDVFHRGSNFTAPGHARFAILTDFKARGRQWQGKLAWPDHAEKNVWNEAMAKMSVRQRDLFGFPPPGSEYWNSQTLRDVQVRYKDMDLTPYR